MPPEYEMRVRNNKMAKYLMKSGHKVKIISASTLHNTNIDLLENSKDILVEKKYEDLEFVHIKTSKYKGNGFSRIINHLQFPLRLLFHYKKISLKPDVIICDLGALFAIFPYIVSKKIRSKFILEVRDLWPESIVEFLGYSRNNPIIKILYLIEKWIYKKSDQIIFSMEGGKDYIVNKGLDNQVRLVKVHYITNGVDIDEFNFNKENYSIDSDFLEDRKKFKVVYTGSIRTANNVGFLVDVAEVIQAKGYHDIKFIIYGDGPDRIALENRCKVKKINNIIFKGQVNKKYVPYIISKSDLNILNYKQTKTWRYGGSQNKLSEYIASKKPILSTINMNYNPIVKFNCGKVCDSSNPKDFANEILYFYGLSDREYNAYCVNSKKAAENLDYKNLTKELERIIQA